MMGVLSEKDKNHGEGRYIVDKNRGKNDNI